MDCVVTPGSTPAESGGAIATSTRLLGKRTVMCALLTATAIVASLAFASLPGLPGSSAADAATTNGVRFGSYVQPRNGDTTTEAVQQLEGSLGAEFPIIRGFHRWEQTLNNGFNNWVASSDRTLMISVKPLRANGDIVRWADIASARPGSQIHNEMIRLAREVAQLDGEVWFTFHHEPEAGPNIVYGTSSEYIDAWRAMHRVFGQEGASVQWVWAMTSFGFDVDESDRRYAGAWYPGDAYVDFLGADPYNWNQCRGNDAEVWTSLEDLVAGFLEFGELHPNKPLVLPEFGSAEGSSGRKAQWLDDAASFFKRPDIADRFEAAIYFHNDHETSEQCDWWLDSSGPTLSAAQRIINDPFFRQSFSTPPPTTTTTAPPTTTTAPPTTTTAPPTTTTAPPTTTTTTAPPTTTTAPPTTTTTAPPPTTTTTPAPVVHRCNGLEVTVDLLQGESPTEGDDVIRGTAGADVINALGGNDTICALGGGDFINAGDGFDRVFAGSGDDLVEGGIGNDKLVGGSGDDILRGGNGNDRLQGGPGNDILRGDNGLDRLAGGNGNDVLSGGGSADLLFGNLGNDQLDGGGGNDVLRGGAWRDVMDGGAGTNDACTLFDPAGHVEQRIDCETGVFGR